MAPQPRLKEIWCTEIFEVSDEVHKHWNIILTRVRQKYTDSRAIEENNRKVWMVNGEVHAVDACRNPGGAFPFTLFRVRAHLCVCLTLCQKNVTQLYWRRHYRNLTTRKQQLLCEHVCLFEVERERDGGESFLAGLITIQPLSNPALPLSTYNMAAYPLARLQTERNLQRRRGRPEGA